LAQVPLRADDPEQIGGYRLTARLGAGGMGLVYLCEAPDGGLVAVKVLRPELADDPEFRRRFQREVSVLTKVKGVCTVRVIEADTESVVPFMVTEFIDGPTWPSTSTGTGRSAPTCCTGSPPGWRRP